MKTTPKSGASAPKPAASTGGNTPPPAESAEASQATELEQLRAQLAEKETALAQANQTLAEQNQQLANKDEIIAQTSKAASGDVTVLKEQLEAKEQELAQAAQALGVQEQQLKDQQSKLIELGVGAEIEQAVRIKMQQGLSREDAVICARRQAKHDEVLKQKFDTDAERHEALVAASSIH